MAETRRHLAGLAVAVAVLAGVGSEATAAVRRGPAVDVQAPATTAVTSTSASTTTPTNNTTTTSVDPLATARRLDELGYHDEARAAARDAIKKNPDAVAEEDEARFDPWPGRTEWLIDNWIVLLIRLGVLVVGVLLAVRLFRYWRATRSPTLHFGTRDGDDPVLSSIVRARLERLAGRASVSLQLSGTTPEATDLPKLGDVDERLKVVDMVFGLLVRPDPITVSPVLGDGGDAPAARAAAIALDSRGISRATSWRVTEAGGDAAEVDAAAAFGAGWLLGALAASELVQQDSIGGPGVTPESHGYVHAGIAALEHGDVPGAQGYFSRAVAASPGDLDARANLAFSAALTSDPEQLAVALDMMLELTGSGDG